MTTVTENRATTAEAFAGRVFDSYLAMVDVLAIYVGERLSLYRAIEDHGPVTVEELHRYAGIHPRYAREWLEHQTISGILDVDAASLPAGERRYSLPVGHSEVLLDRDSLNYLTPLIKMGMASAMVMPEMLEAYMSGGGVSWEQLGVDARTGQADMNRPWYLQAIGSDWFPRVPDLDEALRIGGVAADIGCGEGWSTIAIAGAYPNSTVVGFDVDEPSIEAAKRNAIEAGVSERVQFHAVDVATLDEVGVYDAVVGFEFIHDLAQPVKVLEAMRRMAKPGAPVVIMDENVGEEFASDPDGAERLMYAFSLFVCLPDAMSQEPTAATGTVMRPDTLRSYARDAGFLDAEVVSIDNDLWRFYRMI